MAVWGPNLALNIAAGSTTELVAICDSGGESRRRARKQHPTVLVIATWQDVLDDDDIAAVVIALPRAKHFIVRAPGTQGGQARHGRKAAGGPLLGATRWRPRRGTTAAC